ncbi:hypothetical protein BDF21DRAFT_487444 [Thamnidium elegans]|nr:hypothetical protein BDF21DRAFT_487444 [Thamnidium elegans]
MNYLAITLSVSLVTLPLYMFCKKTMGDDCLYNSVYDTQTFMIYCIVLYLVYGFTKSRESYLFDLFTSHFSIINGSMPSMSAQDMPITTLAARSDRNTPIANDDSLEIEEIPYAAKLINSIEYIKSWLSVRDLLAVTTPYNFKDTTKIYNTETARKYLIELFSIDRTGRLAYLLNHIYFEVDQSKELVESLAVLIMWSFGIPEERETTEFKNIESLLVNALSTPRDSFIFDFVLYTLFGHDLDKTDVLKTMSAADRRPFIDVGPIGINSEIIEKFMKSSFMRKEIKMSRPGLLVRRLKKVKSAILSVLLGCDRKYKKLEAFDELTNLIMRDLNSLHLQIRVLDGKSYAPSPPSPTNTDDSSIMPPYVNESPLKFELDYNTMIKAGTREQGVTFKNDVLPRRINRDEIRSKVEQLMAPDNLKLFVRKRKNPDAYLRLRRIQRSYGNIVYNLSEYERYIYEYEKRFVLGKLFKVCDLFRLELFKVKNRDNAKEIGMLKCLNDQTTTAVWCLDQVYKKFLEFDNSYSRDGYMHQIKMLYKTVLRVNDTDLEDNVNTE